MSKRDKQNVYSSNFFFESYKHTEQQSELSPPSERNSSREVEILNEAHKPNIEHENIDTKNYNYENSRFTTSFKQEQTYSLLNQESISLYQQSYAYLYPQQHQMGNQQQNFIQYPSSSVNFINVLFIYFFIYYRCFIY